ncbi:hypothetical protein BDY19DRAFT_905505 [Irpex rosettiformis]|uniref:Uncharacterized protein n=1 Tax=Irpex rosettiformis TaxID=378272 RepID=A0ACB8U709_9APHY|nr:hypothetical protein BDY19DRAFT_905505 [Irpex rosettiformis]
MPESFQSAPPIAREQHICVRIGHAPSVLTNTTTHNYAITPRTLPSLFHNIIYPSAHSTSRTNGSTSPQLVPTSITERGRGNEGGGKNRGRGREERERNKRSPEHPSTALYILTRMVGTISGLGSDSFQSSLRSYKCIN